MVHTLKLQNTRKTDRPLTARPFLGLSCAYYFAECNLSIFHCLTSPSIQFFFRFETQYITSFSFLCANPINASTFRPKFRDLGRNNTFCFFVSCFSIILCNSKSFPLCLYRVQLDCKFNYEKV